MRNKISIVAFTSFAFTAILWGQKAEAQFNSYSPSAKKYLIRDFHAVGDGKADDTVAVQNALNSVGNACLDGENHTFKITDKMFATSDLCLENATLVQAFVPFDTSPYITPSLPQDSNLPATDASGALVKVDDPANRRVTGADAVALHKSLGMGVLVIRPNNPAKPLKATLLNLHVVYGLQPEGKSVGISVQNADTVYFNRVECTGKGHGKCISIEKANNVQLDNLYIHDMVWAPYKGDYPLIESKVRDFREDIYHHAGWNSFPLYVFIQDDPTSSTNFDGKFYQVRAQEQAFGMALVDVTNCTINNIYLQGVLAKFDTGNLPVQGDGIDVGGNGSNITFNGGMVQRTWEGVDVGGHSISGMVFDGMNMRDNWGFGYKIGYVTSDVVVKNAFVDKSGIAGVVVYGADVKNVSIENLFITDTGFVDTVVGGRYPWPYVGGMKRSGVLLMQGASDVTISQTSAKYSMDPKMAPPYEFVNLLSSGGRNNRLLNSSGSGYSVSEEYGF